MRVEVQIDFTNIINTTLTLGTSLSGLRANNVSNSDRMINNTSTGLKAFQLSEPNATPVSTLNNKIHLFPATGYPGFMSNKATMAYIPKAYAYLVLNGAKPDYLYITFDRVYNEYATFFRINYTDINGDSQSIGIENTSVDVTIPFADINIGNDLQDVTLEFQIYTWSNAQGNIKVSRISLYPPCVYTGADIINIICSENAYDSQLNVQPGICEQYADLDIYDRGNYLHKLAKEQKLTADDLHVTILAIDDAQNLRKVIGVYAVSEYKIDSNSSVVTFACRDMSYTLTSLNFVPTAISNRTVDDMLNEVFEQNNILWQYADMYTEISCQNTIVPNSWFKSGTLIDTLQKICYLGMLRIYWYVDTFLVTRCY